MDLLHTLKTSTSQYHHQIEQVDLLKKIITNEITLPEYKKLLCQLYGFRGCHFKCVSSAEKSFIFE